MLLLEPSLASHSTLTCTKPRRILPYFLQRPHHQRSLLAQYTQVSPRLPSPQARLVFSSDFTRLHILTAKQGGQKKQKDGVLHASIRQFAFTAVRSGSDNRGLPDGSDAAWAERDSKQSARIWSAVGLIVGTAVGPGILGLPASMLQAGLFPSSLLIIAAWLYVIGSVLLVVELSYAMMEEQGGAQVSYTGLAIRTLGKSAGFVVSLVYASMNYALLVACISGLASVISRWLPAIPETVLCMLCPTLMGLSITVASFEIIDSMNKILCAIMLGAISCLVSLGVSLGRNDLLKSLSYRSWAYDALLPGLPVAVLTLGFHVITPLVCKVVGGRPQDARKAVICGGLVPLLMVLSWNMVILGLAPSRSSPGRINPINLLLSVSSFAAPAVQVFAFCALGTTLIGYALSFPKQLLDILSVFRLQRGFKSLHHQSKLHEVEGNSVLPIETIVSPSCGILTADIQGSLATVSDIESNNDDTKLHLISLVLALAPPMVAATFYSGAFVAALDFAGIYANCLLFGVLPPIMAYVSRYGSLSRQNHKLKSQVPLLPGGKLPLFLLLIISIYLGVFNA